MHPSLPVIVLPSLLIVIAAAALGVIAVRASHAVHGGRYDRLPAGPGALRLRSDFGLFELGRGRTSLRLTGDRQVAIVSLDRPASIAVHRVAALAPQWLEFVLGAETFDLFGQADAGVAWQVVVIALEDGRQVPVFAVGQVPLDGAGPMARLLQRLRLMPDAQARARRVQAELMRHLPAIVDAEALPVGGASAPKLLE